MLRVVVAFISFSLGCANVPEDRRTDKEGGNLTVSDPGPVPASAHAVSTAAMLAPAMPASTGELMTDRCSDMVAIVPSYDAKPNASGTVLLVRRPDGWTEWTEPFEVKLGPDGHIRWWCHSTTGNFFDPGTWRIKEVIAGGTVTCERCDGSPGAVEVRPSGDVKFT